MLCSLDISNIDISILLYLRLIESMMGLRSRQGNLRLVFRLFKSYARKASHKTLII